MKTICKVVVSAALLLPFTVKAEIIDFTGIGSQGYPKVLESYLTPIYLEDGFSLSATGTPIALLSAPASAANLLEWTGQEAMGAIPGSTVVLQSTIGAPFSLTSIDLIKSTRLNFGGNTVTLTGYKLDGSIVMQELTLGTEFAFTTYALTGFAGLAAVTWTEPLIPLHAFQVDNIVLTPVPEPGIAAMLGVGVALLGLARRRKGGRSAS
jgi:hypothetical protein